MAVKKNTLSFGLVTTPIGLIAARPSSRESGALKLATKDGEPVEQVYKVAGKVKTYKKGDLSRGVLVNETEIKLIDEEVLKAIDEETKLDAVEVLGFIPQTDVPVARITDVHYIRGQQGISIHALGLVVQALRGTDKVAIVKFSVGKKQRPGAIAVGEDGVTYLYSLAPKGTLVEPDDAVYAPSQIEVPKAELELARELIDRLSVNEDGEPLDGSLIDTITDERAAAQEALIADALAGKVPEPKKKPEVKVPTPDDIIAKLAESIAADSKKKSKKKAVAK